jgi:hypothetical protein
MSLSSPQTSSDLRVSAGLSSPIEGIVMTMKHRSLANAPFFLSPKGVSRGKLVCFVFFLYALVAPSRYLLSRSDIQFARFTAISVGVG